MPTTTGNMLIAQSGGPTMVINQSLVGAVLEALKHKCIKRIYGSLHGIQGILDENFIDLRKETKSTLEAIAKTPSSALGTVRKKPTAADCATIFTILHKHNIRYFFYIGGNDSAETTHIINEEAKQENYELHCFHIPKTIDNDLRENDHTPGFGSAAKFVASAFIGDDLDNRALGGVKINIIMGRHAGFLTAAAALARTRADDGPHLIYLPERPFSLPQFARDVKAVYARLGRCVVAVSEGIADKKGTKIKRVRADTFGYLQRSFAGIVSETDSAEAREAGATAVRVAVTTDTDGSIAIKRKTGKHYAVTFKRVPLKNVARETREMPARFINKAGNNITKAFLDYASPIVGPLPQTARFKTLS
jgi:6-phosphofructokinase